MATRRQKKAVIKMVENGGIVSRAMVESGYSPATAKNPQKLTESKGFREILEYNGLNEDLISRALVEDIVSKPGKRGYELNLGAEIVGMKKKTEQANPINIVVFPTEVIEKNAIQITPSPSPDSQGQA